MVGKAKKQEAQRLTSWDDVAPHNVILDVETIDGSIFVVEMKTLSYSEWERIGKLVSDPRAPELGTPSGISYNFKDPAYQQSVVAANMRRLHMRLAESLHAVTPLPGDTIEARTDFLLTRDSQVINTLISALIKTHNERTARVQTRAESFLGA